MTPFVMLLIPTLVCALLALVFALGLRRCLRQRQWLGASWRLGAFALLLTTTLSLGLLAGALFHYLTFGADEHVATLSLRQLEPQHYAVRLESADGQHRSFELRGDEWQLDARLIRWQLPARLAGAPNLYRLERLSGRYGDPKQELEAVRSVHPLAQDAFPDLWTLKRQFPQYLPFVDSDYGSAAYLPMLDGARYDVTLGPRGGLVAKPADAKTQALLDAAGW